MSFSDIRLPDIVIADFYKSSLVELSKNEQKTAKIDVSKLSLLPLQHLGENLRNILILVNYPQETHLPPEQLDFLSNILKACQMGIADIAIINTANLQGTLDDYVDTLNPKAVLSFGAQQLAIARNAEMIYFNIVDFGGIMVVSCPALENLKGESVEGRLLKKQLWECLKKLFNI